MHFFANHIMRLASLCSAPAQLLQYVKIQGLDNSNLANIPVANDIEKDLHRTFPNNSNFLEEEGINSLRRLLHAYSVRNPEVGYCQSMNFLAALLLLNMEEDRAFWTLAAIIEDLLPSEFYTKNMVGSRAEQRVLLSCLKWKLPRLHAHFVTIGVAPSSDSEDCVPLLEPLTCTWYLCLFLNSLSLESSLRVWDAFLHEGRKVLLRIGLTVLYSAQEALLKCDDLCGVYEVLRNNSCIRANSNGNNATQQVPMITSDNLINMSYDKSWIGSFPHGKIDDLREKHRMKVAEEVKEIEERRRVREEKEAKRKKEKEKEVEEEVEEEEEADDFVHIEKDMDFVIEETNQRIAALSVVRDPAASTSSSAGKRSSLFMMINTN